MKTAIKTWGCSFLPYVFATAAVALPLPVFADETVEDSFSFNAPSSAVDFDGGLASPQQQTQQRGRGGRGGGGRMEGMYKAQITPNWLANNTKFWYRNDLAGGTREFILVDAERGTRERAFDHELVAKQIGNDAEATKLPVEELKIQCRG